MKILVTGCAGFIGFHVCLKLLQSKKIQLYGIDNLNNFYDVEIKKKRLKLILKQKKNFIFYKLDIKNQKKILNNFKKNKYTHVLHFAANAGVRFSITNSKNYIDDNILGFYNILEAGKKYKISHLVYASSSSVYGETLNFPSKEDFSSDKPISLYAATKKTNEILSYSYSSIYKLPVTGLRFFTVYGPFGRPDMAIFKFCDKIFNSKKIELYNKGDHYRDFTYIDDVVAFVCKILYKSPKSKIPNEIYNIGSGISIKLTRFLKEIDLLMKRKYTYKKLPFQKGDVIKTHSDISKIVKKTGYSPKYKIEEGLSKYVQWFLNYYGQKK